MGVVSRNVGLESIFRRKYPRLGGKIRASARALHLSTHTVPALAYPLHPIQYPCQTSSFHLIPHIIPSLTTFTYIVSQYITFPYISYSISIPFAISNRRANPRPTLSYIRLPLPLYTHRPYPTDPSGMPIALLQAPSQTMPDPRHLRLPTPSLPIA